MMRNRRTFSCTESPPLICVQDTPASPTISQASERDGRYRSGEAFSGKLVVSYSTGNFLDREILPRQMRPFQKIDVDGSRVGVRGLPGAVQGVDSELSSQNDMQVDHVDELAETLSIQACSTCSVNNRHRLKSILYIRLQCTGGGVLRQTDSR